MLRSRSCEMSETALDSNSSFIICWHWTGFCASVSSPIKTGTITIPIKLQSHQIIVRHKWDNAYEVLFRVRGTDWVPRKSFPSFPRACQETEGTFFGVVRVTGGSTAVQNINSDLCTVLLVLMSNLKTVLREQRATYSSCTIICSFSRFLLLGRKKRNHFLFHLLKNLLKFSIFH